MVGWPSSFTGSLMGASAPTFERSECHPGDRARQREAKSTDNESPPMKKRLPQRSEEVFSPSGGSTALPSLLRTFPRREATAGSEQRPKGAERLEREEVGGGKGWWAGEMERRSEGWGRGAVACGTPSASEVCHTPRSVLRSLRSSTLRRHPFPLPPTGAEWWDGHRVSRGH